jgi:predicted Zn-dependent protease
LQDDPRALRVGIWKTTDRVYQQAVEHLTKVRANTTVKVDQEDQSPDFSREDKTLFLEESLAPSFEPWIWRERIRKLSARFAAHPELLIGNVSVHASRNTTRLVNTEGSLVRQSSNAFRMTLFGLVKADDGMEIPLNRTLMAASPAEFPGDDEIEKEIDAMIETLIAMKTAPMITAYEGPVILEGRASGVFFHELLGHRVEGHRLRVDEAAQTFKKKLGEQILPSGYEIVFDPTIERFSRWSAMACSANS